jgi:iron complex outermembrane receptor protein
MSKFQLSASALAIIAAVPALGLASAAQAQTATVDPSLEAVIVTGTRLTGLRAGDSAAPVEVLDAVALTRTGRPDLVQALNQNLPSFNAQSFGGDASNLKLSARLRGLSANHALILVDGKRRHGTSNLTVSATGGYSGAAAADLTFIPSAAIDHIEVLQDGAAAQYGTDAIAGVINIILKNSGRGGTLTTSGGAYYEGDGRTGNVTANIGLGAGSDAFLNLTGEYRHHGYSDRGGPDQRVFTAANRANPALPLLPGYPHLNYIYGDAKYDLYLASYNAGYQLSGNVQLYSFGSYGHRVGNSRQNFRFPSIAPTIWPQGFTPVITDKENDLSFTGGIKGKAADWTWDLSSTYGRDDNALGNIHSVNTSLVADTGTSPTDFHVGDFIATQWTNNLDISREFEIGAAGPLNVALGVEQRRETFELKAGEPASRYKTGVQAYPGFSLSDAAKHSRDNIGAYVDLALSPVEGLQLDLAGRYEHFSDFGDAVVGKLTGRYDFSPAFALRGTVSTGFRAPTLAESYYSATTVSPTQAGVRLPPNNSSAKLLGIDPLDSEKSTNFSLGFVAHPAPKLTATFDAYQIGVRNRIVSTGSIYGLQNNVLRSQSVTDAIRANGNTLDSTVTSTFIQTFVNGANTRTRGAELVVTYASDFGDHGAVDWSLGANYNTTKVTKIYPVSAQIAASGQKYLDTAAISFLETAAPKYKVSLGALYKSGKWGVSLRETLYGKASTYVDGGSNNNYVNNAIGAKLITDLDVGYQATRSIRVSVGADNLFDTRPDRINPVTYAASLAAGGNGTATTSSFSAFGINGGYYYGRVAFSF